MTKEELIKWCDEQVDQKYELKLKWDGGDDSGWVYFEIDGQQQNNLYIDNLIKYMEEHLDYGSWAGDFSASGSAVYNKDAQSFIGEDNYYSGDVDMDWDWDIFIKLPKNLWWDSISLEMSGHEEDNPQVEATINMKNGFHTEEHAAALKEMSEYISQEAINAIDDFSKNHDFRNIWVNTTIDRSEFEEDGDFLVYNLGSINMGTYNSHDRYVCLDLNEIELENLQNQ